MSTSYDTAWINTFCIHNDLFCNVNEEYIRNRINLVGLEKRVEDFDDAIETILYGEYDVKGSKEDESYQQVVALYGLIHARFILTGDGLLRMREKLLRGDFEICRRVTCEDEQLLPIGLSDNIKENTVKLYCSHCRDVYEPELGHNDIDGAYFGTSFPHLLFMKYPELVTVDPPRSSNSAEDLRIPDSLDDPRAAEGSTQELRKLE